MEPTASASSGSTGETDPQPPWSSSSDDRSSNKRQKRIYSHDTYFSSTSAPSPRSNSTSPSSSSNNNASPSASTLPSSQPASHASRYNPPSRAVLVRPGISPIDGSPSFAAMPKEGSIVFFGQEYLRNCSEGWAKCPLIESDGVLTCPFGDFCNFDHDTCCIRPSGVPILAERPASISFGRDEATGLPTIELYDNVFDGGANGWMRGVAIDEDDHSYDDPDGVRYANADWVKNKWWGDVAEWRDDIVEDYDSRLPLPPIRKTPWSVLDTASNEVLREEFQQIQMQTVLVAVSRDLVSVSDDVRAVQAHAESSVKY